VTRPAHEAAAPALSRARFRWWDALVVFLAGQVGSIVAFGIGYGLSGDEAGDPGALTVGFGAAGLFAAYAIALWLVCRRRGTGSLVRDLGLRVRARDWWALPLGTGCAVAFGLLVLPLTWLVDERQAVVDDLNDATGAELAVFAVMAALLAPVFEELIFRGLLLRSLLFLMPIVAAVTVTAVAFGAVHFLGGNPLGTLAVLPALIGLGAVAAVLAVRSGELSQPILLHVGFNLLAVLGALLG
jgi:membrane protease YdiL (CAAX protease family)